MTTYLVMKRMKEDRVFLPGEVLVDPIRADRLLERGYLTIVPDDYAEKHGAAAAETRRPTVAEALDMGYSEAAAKTLAAGRKSKKLDEETEKIEARKALREERGPDELERLAAILGTTAEGVLDLDDDEYEAVLEENPPPSEPEPEAIAEVEESRKTPRQELTDTPDDRLAVLANEHGVLPPEGITAENRKDIIDEILIKAGYKEAPEGEGGGDGDEANATTTSTTEITPAIEP